MDIDAFTAVHAAEWDRLKELSSRRRLDGAESDELVRLYQSVATHLSTVRSAAPDPALVTRLSDVLNRARTRIAGTHEPAWREVVRFAMVSLPAAFYRIRWWSHAVTAACLLVAIVAGIHVAGDTDAMNSLMPPAAQEEYVNEAFASYYEPGIGFAAVVGTNNAWIAAQAVGGGITGIFPLIVLWQNAVQIGAYGGMMAAHGELELFLTLIAPHGLLELTCIFVAGAAGLRIFWTLIDPGPRKRSVAMAAEGRALITTAIGLAAALSVSALVEGFVTGSEMYWWLKIVIGAIVLAGFWAYVYVLGRRAVRAGATGDLAEHEAGATVVTAG
ncbi:stage II sporulation protein M [Promicromonospora iranensis]|uniref:Membrane protein SpoIIM required for sporulation n=1 Tax=Promicromonospora iranensis TaxID=1105144 RepID=A0ABU2CRZ5_9MICO|nr:stage II sporulation protein M [Promicromonospora iranensis]MDR7384117.1 putative membrane protein SpoIIM required for sporulation [Promicromonospora iranensis]